MYQVGANVGDTIAVSLQQGVAANQIGQFSQQTGTAVNATALTSINTVTVSDGTSTATVGPTANYIGATTYQGATSAYAKAAAINGAGLQGLTASAAKVQTDNTAFNTISGGTNGAGSTGATASSYTLTINGTTIFAGGGNVAVGQTLTGAQVATQVDLFTGTTGVTAAVNTSGQVVLSNTDGSDIVTTQAIALGVAGSTGGAAGAAGAGTGLGTTLAAGGTGSSLKGSITVTDSTPVTFTDAGSGGGGGSADLGFTTGVATQLSQAGGQAATLANQNVLTVAGANSTISSIDAALTTVSAFQSQLGAIQNRFTAAVGNLQSTAQNLTQSRSTIQDADFAAETANLTQAQVLEQAGISVLAQANQQPQLILKLLA